MAIVGIVQKFKGLPCKFAEEIAKRGKAITQRRISKGSNPPLLNLKPLTTDTVQLNSTSATPKRLQEILDNLVIPERSVYAVEYNGIITDFLGNRPEYAGIVRKYVTDLYKVGEKKFDLITNYSHFGFNCPWGYEKDFIEAVNKFDINELRQTFTEISSFYGNSFLKYSKQAKTLDFTRLTILKANSKEAYEYLLNYPNKEEVLNMLDCISGCKTIFSTLTVPQIRQMLGQGLINKSNIENGRSVVSNYIKDSAHQNKGERKKLSEYLSNITITEPFSAYRGDRTVGMFNSVPLSILMSIKTRYYTLIHKTKAKKLNIVGYNTDYNASACTNLYEFIKRKKELSLADAMQIFKFGQKKYREKVIELIRATELEDNRFKSLTFDKNFAQKWITKNRANDTVILQNIGIEKGLQGCFTNNPIQNEYILNNNKKLLTFQNVRYDDVNDIFLFDSNISLTKQ